MRGHQWRHPAGHLTHGREQWQRIVTQPHRLVGNGDIVRRDERVSAFARSGEVQVREEHLILVRGEAMVFRRDRFLHFPSTDRSRPDVIGRLDDGRSVGDVVGVNDRGADAGASFDEYSVTGTVSSRAPAGVSATRYSSVLISFGTPMIIVDHPFWFLGPIHGSHWARPRAPTSSDALALRVISSHRATGIDVQLGLRAESGPRVSPRWWRARIGGG